MRAGLIEIVGLFLVVVGCAGLVGAASLVSTPLAVATAAAFILLGGIIAVYVAAQLAQADKAGRVKAGPGA